MTIRNFLGSPTEYIALENQGNYEIPCRDCNKTYIGKTNRRMSALIIEHAIKNKDTNSVLLIHNHNTGHKIEKKPRLRTSDKPLKSKV